MRGVSFWAAFGLVLCTGGIHSETLYDLALKGEVVPASEMARLGIGINEEGDLGTPLHVAAIMDDIAMANVLLTGRVNVDIQRSATLATPLHVAASYGRARFAKWLLEHGAAVDSMDVKGSRPIHLAVEKGDVETVRVLLDHGAQPDVLGGCGRWTPLHLALQRGNERIIMLLLSKHPNVNIAADYETPLHVAAAGSSGEIIEVLVAMGADVNARESRGMTPLAIAEAVGNHEATDMLRRLGAHR